MKKFIFNKYKLAYKNGPQHILITSSPLIQIIDQFLKNHPDQEYLLMRKGEQLDNKQVREILRTEMGSKKTQFGVRAIRRLFATYLIQEKKTNPRKLKEYAHKMGTSVEMLMSNYVQVEDGEDDDEYKGIGEMFEDSAEKEQKQKKNKKNESQRSDEYKAKKRARANST